MNKKKIFKSVVASALCVATILSIILGAVFLMPTTETQAATVSGNNFDFDFKKPDGSKVAISFMGDSITTFMNYSNNPDYNTTLAHNAVYYGWGGHPNATQLADLKVEETWWMQTVNTLGMELCVNNSWSASKVRDSKTTDDVNGNSYTVQGAYKERCYQLHNDNTGKQPDIIVVFLGTNDVGGVLSDSNVYGTGMLKQVEDNYLDETKPAGTVCGAYAYMIRRIMATYPEAEIYCCSLLPQQDERLSGNQAAYAAFHKGLNEIIQGYSTGVDPTTSNTDKKIHKHGPGIHLVDFYNDSGVHQDRQSRENCYFYDNRLHPKEEGMDAMSNLLISELMEHSQYMNAETVSVSYDLANAYVEVGNVSPASGNMYGDVTRAVIGKPFQVKFNAKGTPNISYRVTMSGVDITDSVVSNNTVTIPYVSGDIVIQAHEFDYFHWKANSSGLVSASGGQVHTNTLTNYHTATGTNAIKSFANNAVEFGTQGRAYEMAEPVNLLHDRNWILEIKAAGEFTEGVLLMSSSKASSVGASSSSNGRRNNVHIYFAAGGSGIRSFGITTETDSASSDTYYQYGVGLGDKNHMGSDVITDYATVMHVYTMFNQYNPKDGTNTIYISVDGKNAHPMTNAASGGSFTSSDKVAQDQMCGRDLTFNTLGTFSTTSQAYHPLRNCKIEYIKVWENGNPDTYNHDEFNNYYWDFGSSVTSITSSGFTSNKMTFMSVDGSTYPYNADFSENDQHASSKGRFQLEKPVVLMADRPWIFEFYSAKVGGMLLTSDTDSGVVIGNTYVHLNTENFYFGFTDEKATSTGTASGFNNSGLTWAKIAETVSPGTDATTFVNSKHTYRMVNVVNSDGSNKIQLYVDGKLIGDLFASDSRWSRRNYVINYLGSKEHPITGINLDWMKVYENGIPISDDKIDNFRWEPGTNGMESVDQSTYFTENTSTVKLHNATNGVHELSSYYNLAKPVRLMHDRSWNVEWRASGSWGGTDGAYTDDPMLFSSHDQRTVGMTYIWRNSKDLLVMGCWERAGNFQNYGIHIANTDFGPLSDDKMYTYRLENRVFLDDEGNYLHNMVYLYIDGEEIGAMDNYFLNGTNQKTKDEWISGQDFEFNFIGNKQFYLLDVNFEYIQVWEDGYRVDTSRLDYLLANRETRFEGVTDESWNAYQKALTAAEATKVKADVDQSAIDKAVQEVIHYRNLLAVPSEETKILSTELVTGEFARRGKQVGVKIITTPDVVQLEAQAVYLITNSSKIQTLMIDGKETVVKVWLVSWTYGNELGNYLFDWHLGAWNDYDGTRHIGNDWTKTEYHDHTEMNIYQFSRFVTSISIEKEPDKMIYSAYERFDPTGMKVVATYNKADGDGNYTGELDLNDIIVENPAVYEGNTRIYISYQGARAYVDVDIQVNKTVLGVHDVAASNIGDFVTIEGYFVGYGNESGVPELWLKDKETSDLVSVKLADYGDLSEVYADRNIGSLVSVTGYVAENENSEYTASIKRYLSVSTVNAIEWLDNEARTMSYANASFSTITDWQTMKDSLKVDNETYSNTTPAYGYYEFTGTMSLIPMINDDDSVSFIFHMNENYYNYESEDQSAFFNDFGQYYVLSDQFGDGSVFQNVLVEALEEAYNNGDVWYTWEDLLYAYQPSIQFEGTIRAAYIVGADYRIDLTILDERWITIDTSTIVFPEQI